MNILAKKDDHAEVYQPSRGLSLTEVGRLERYLDAIRSTLLFAKGVVLVEGDAEQIMIPAMLRAVFGVVPDELGFSVISMDSAFFRHLAIIFASDRVRRPCSIVTDLDKSLIVLPSDPGKDSKQETHARAAEVSGTLRHTDLQGFADNNPWIQTFFADHTFEADFVMSNNAREVSSTLKEIYTNAAARESSKALLDATDRKLAGLEALRLAEKVGKGWFAMLLSEKLDTWTFIPEYILRAIAFACNPSVTAGTIKRIGQFRVTAQVEGDLAAALPGLDELDAMEPDAFVAAYREAAPDDDLSLFCQYVEEYRQA